METVLFLWRWRVYSGGFCTSACALHLGEEHRELGEDPARNKRRTAAGRGGEEHLQKYPKGAGRLFLCLLC